MWFVIEANFMGKIDNCVEMVFVDFPSNLIVEGCAENRVPSWNMNGEQLYEATFLIGLCGK